MLKRGHAGSDAVVDAVVDMGRDDVVAGVDLGIVDVGTFVDAGSDICCVISSCVL